MAMIETMLKIWYAVAAGWEMVLFAVIGLTAWIIVILCC
jgi:hypothetical protein